MAEVLITLAIIGVIAAMTLPTLISDTTSAQIGPKLAKAVASFEQANEVLLTANASDTLSEAGVIKSKDIYFTELTKYLKGNNSTSGRFDTKDGMSIYIEEIDTTSIDSTDPAYKQRIGTIVIDINATSKPNASGSDKFYFSWWNDGSLRPKGAIDWDGNGQEDPWNNYCPLAEKGSVSNPDYCAGHIFENNLKVLYR